MVHLPLYYAPAVSNLTACERTGVGYDRLTVGELRKPEHMKRTFIAGLMVCFVLAWATPGGAQDSSEGKSVAAGTKQIAPKDIMKSLVGSWEGTCTTWLQGDKPADESKV